MLASREELLAVLRRFNPWWHGGRPTDLPTFRRAAFRGISTWVENPPGNRALLLTGARQVGKSTLFLQAIDRLLGGKVNPTNILYLTLDHPLLKLAGLDTLLQIWREYYPIREGHEYLFLDEIQMTKDWQTWLKHQVDFEKRRRIAVTGSAMALLAEGQESGVGRWQTIKLPTLSFFEFLQIRKSATPEVPHIQSLREAFDWSQEDFTRVSGISEPLLGLFHEYLVRGGFPQCALLDSIALAQKLLREDIVDKVLKRDMTALFGVRRVLELEQVFLYLCLHDGGRLDMPELCNSLHLKKPTVSSFISLLEATHLIYRLMPFGYGKTILRGQPKIHLADPAIAPSVLLRGESLWQDSTAMGHAVEGAFFKHVFTHYYAQSARYSYWRGKRDHEVDIIADLGERLIPFEVKYRRHAATDASSTKGLVEFCNERNVDMGYIITRDMSDFGVDRAPTVSSGTRFLRIPAALACYCLGRSEVGAV